MIRPALLSVFGALLLGASAAHSAVVTTTTSGHAARWLSPRLELVVYEPPAESGITKTQLLAAGRNAADQWASWCSTVAIEVTAASGPAVARRDQKNSVIVRVGTWCGDPVRGERPCYAKQLRARTEVYIDHPSGTDAGIIREADIEINAADYPYRGTEEDVERLEILMTHEVGHVLGLAHNCGPVARSVGRGKAVQQVPACDSEPDLRDEIMHPSAAGGATADEPTWSEQRALCRLYPSRLSPSCGMARSRTEWPWAFVVFVALLPLARRGWRSEPFR